MGLDEELQQIQPLRKLIVLHKDRHSQTAIPLNAQVVTITRDNLDESSELLSQLDNNSIELVNTQKPRTSRKLAASLATIALYETENNTERPYKCSVKENRPKQGYLSYVVSLFTLPGHRPRRLMIANARVKDNDSQLEAYVWRKL